MSKGKTVGRTVALVVVAVLALLGARYVWRHAHLPPHFYDAKWFEAGWGKLSTTPLAGGIAVLLAAILAFLANWWKISADKADTGRKIKAATADLEKKIAAERSDSDLRLAAASAELEKKIAAERSESDRRLAAGRDEAARARRGEAYVEVLRVVGRIGHWAQLVRPITDTNPPQPPPELPDVEQQATSQAQLEVYGTRQVRELWAAWNACVNDVQDADKLIGLVLDPSRNVTGAAYTRGLDVWGQLTDEFRPKEREARRALAEQMNRELTDGAQGN